MAYNFVDDYVGAQPITTADDVQKHVTGTILKAFDPTYGVGEFMYLQNTTGGAVAIGDALAIDERTGATTEAVAATRGPLGIAMGALAISQYGWFQIGGSAVIKAAAAAAAAPGYLNAAAGSIINTVVAGQKVDGCVFKTANGTPSAGFAVAQIARPSANGNG